ncbi:SDR family NAD(P)-dependent oxidoreductase [Bradyrhizobium sp. CB1717]|uniref:SDR family NAD(P)-dependent oxidoreductase n=1 Tax=Bradyrhizobium sp. CB1717 TaxID=3039154 RepID=UPI0024B1D82F|nr:SDR family NAD(P)-dependent oxidoreductase [Bradyrhizobium sp. CB1717]WFU22070.1 SDR family NAD(P)-dependent oxidoreductase [Bradyrhizobium sp. CB1717]
MAIVFITGSTDGLGRAAAQSLIDQGHRVVLHARSADRAAAVADFASHAAGIVVGDLRSAVETKGIADQVNAIGRMDAIIHNAGVYTERSRGSSAEGHAGMLAINTLAPYMLTALIARPKRLVYLSSGLHRGGEGSLRDLDWTRRSWDAAKAYAESKLHAVALACALARRWPHVLSSGRPERRFCVVLTIIRLDFNRAPTMDGERPGRKTDRQDAGTADAENSAGSIRPLRAFLSGIDLE